MYKLNGGPKANIFVSDPTNASRTMFMNIHKLTYEPQLLTFFDLDTTTPKLHLPKNVPSSDPDAYGNLTTTNPPPSAAKVASPQAAPKTPTAPGPSSSSMSARNPSSQHTA